MFATFRQEGTKWLLRAWPSSITAEKRYPENVHIRVPRLVPRSCVYNGLQKLSVLTKLAVALGWNETLGGVLQAAQYAER